MMKFFAKSETGVFFCFLLIPLILSSHPGMTRSPENPPANFKIAFIGDQGLRERSKAVLNLIKNEEANAVVHAGDFDYKDNPMAWEAQINEVLGPGFPYFCCVGNHDKDKFYGPGGYQEFIAARMTHLGIPWDGDLGVQSSFHYEGIFFLLTAPGIFGTEPAGYIREKLREDDSIWSISVWHLNMRVMQVGGKQDETGWDVYEESRESGAIIATAHEHSYSRTHLLSSMESQIVADRSDTLVLTQDLNSTPEDEGKTFAFVSGLGGKSIRDQELSGDWWASIYTSNQGAKAGALFGVFNHNGAKDLARFYFKNIDGEVIDSFFAKSNVEVEKVVTSIDSNFTGVLQEVTLEQNYPNPFNPGTEIRFQLPKSSQVVIKIYNLLGEEIRLLTNSFFAAGSHGIQWNGKHKLGNNVASGVYLYRIETDSFSQVKKMTLLR